MPQHRNEIPVRTIATTIGMVLATVVAVWLVFHLSRVLIWIIIAAFFAVVLAPLVGFLQRRARMPRPLATLSALLSVFIVLAGIITLLVIPLVGAVQPFLRRLPHFVQQAQNGEGPIGSLLRRFDVVDLVRDNLDSIRVSLGQLGDPALDAVVTAGNVVVGVLVVLVLSFLLALQGPGLVDQVVGLLPSRHHERARKVLRHSGRAVTGYVSGQLLIATLCGMLTYLVLLIMGVPFAGVVALFVGVMGLVPVVGATIGGLLAVGLAFLHSVLAGIVVAIFFLVYQQVENHMLQPVIQARTVHLNALMVLISVLIGVELAGIVGALLAIPAAGIVKVVAGDLWVQRQAGGTDTDSAPGHDGGAARHEASGVPAGGGTAGEAVSPTAPTSRVQARSAVDSPPSGVLTESTEPTEPDEKEGSR